MDNLKKILDNYVVSGIDYNEFKKANAEMENITKDFTARGLDITFLSYSKIKSSNERLVFYVLDDVGVEETLVGGNFRCVSFPPQDLGGEAITEELKNTTGLIMIIGGQWYLVSDLAIPTLSTQAQVKGDLTISRQNLVRNMHFADAVRYLNVPIHFVYREVEIKGYDGKVRTIKKIVAAMGGYFTPIPQTIITKAADMVADEAVLGRVVCRAWTVDHEYTRLYLEFPDMAEDFKAVYKLPHSIVPGVMISTSDIGRSSVIARGVFRYGLSASIYEEVSYIHKGGIGPEVITEKINEKIFSEVRRLPETLAKLMAKPVIDYEKIDLTSDSDAESNFIAVRDLIEKIANPLKKTIGAKRIKSLLDCLNDEINSSLRYTYYDIAMIFMGLPERLEGMDESSLVELQKACASVPYTLEKIAGKKESEIVLLPS